MNIALIFAGGVGQRMKMDNRPKQFLELNGKPILIYTLEKFQLHPEINGIILVVVKEWIEYTKDLVKKFRITKTDSILAGGKTCFESISRGISEATKRYDQNAIVLIHDGVRPLIDEKTITNNIASVKNKGNAITVTSAIETITVQNEKSIIDSIVDRSQCKLARAPQSFYLRDIADTIDKAVSKDQSFIDCASLMHYYGYKLYTVDGPIENIKITTPLDYHLFKALIEAKNNPQLIEQ